MTFEEFQLEVGDGTHVLIDGHEHVVLLSTPDLILARPEGSPLSWSLAQATVDVVQLTDLTWVAWEVEIC